MLVTVSRLADSMKAESLLRTIDVVRVLGRELPLRFVIVGDGAGGPKVEALARATNDELGRDAVVLTGALIDPRPAYAMADIVVGMGGSALRGMAFSKPVVVVGERGFARAFTPRTVEFFRYKGMYGVGDGHPGNDGFAATVRELATDAGLRQQLGAHARNFVVKEYSLETLSARLDCFCKQAVSHPSRLHTATADGLRTARSICASAGFSRRRATPRPVRRCRANRRAMSVNDLVSILVPAHNCERWIGECLSSAVGQTWPRKEVIVVDDGSADGTLAAARAHESATVKVVSQENRGASAARNHALSLAQGRYIQWLDADDVLAPDKITRQMAAAQWHGELTLHACRYGVFHYRLAKAKFSPTALWRDHTPMSWTLARFTNKAWMVPAAWLVSRRVTEAAGPWDERLSAQRRCGVLLPRGAGEPPRTLR